MFGTLKFDTSQGFIQDFSFVGGGGGGEPGSHKTKTTCLKLLNPKTSKMYYYQDNYN